MKNLIIPILLTLVACNDDSKKSNFNDDSSNTFYEICTYFDEEPNGMTSPQFINSVPYYGSDVVCGRSVLGDRDVYLWTINSNIDPESVAVNLVLKSDQSLHWEVFVAQRMYDDDGAVIGTLPVGWFFTNDGEIVITDIHLLNTHPVFNDFIIRPHCIEDSLEEDFAYLLEVWLS